MTSRRCPSCEPIGPPCSSCEDVARIMGEREFDLGACSPDFILGRRPALRAQPSGCPDCRCGTPGNAFKHSHACPQRGACWFCGGDDAQGHSATCRCPYGCGGVEGRHLVGCYTETMPGGRRYDRSADGRKSAYEEFKRWQQARAAGNLWNDETKGEVTP